MMGHALFVSERSHIIDDNKVQTQFIGGTSVTPQKTKSPLIWRDPRHSPVSTFDGSTENLFPASQPSPIFGFYCRLFTFGVKQFRWGPYSGLWSTAMTCS